MMTAATKHTATVISAQQDFFVRNVVSDWRQWIFAEKNLCVRKYILVAAVDADRLGRQETWFGLGNAGSSLFGFLRERRKWFWWLSFCSKKGFWLLMQFFLFLQSPSLSGLRKRWELLRSWWCKKNTIRVRDNGMLRWLTGREEDSGIWPFLTRRWRLMSIDVQYYITWKEAAIWNHSFFVCCEVRFWVAICRNNRTREQETMRRDITS